MGKVFQFIFIILFISNIKVLNAQDYIANQVFIKIDPNALTGDLKSEAKVKDLMKLYQVKSIEPAFRLPELRDIYLVQFNKEGQETAFIEQFSKLPYAEYAERVPLYKTSLIPNDPSFASQWSLTKVKADLAWNMTQGSATVKIAVVDDAVLLTHQDLSSKIWVNPGEISGNGIDDDANGYIDDVNGWDAADNDNNPNPFNPSNYYFSHGTHVAGITAGATNNATGIASIGFNCKILPVKIGNNVTSSLTGAYSGVEYAIAAKANVINMSWGGGAFSMTYQLLFNLAKSKGIVCVAAAGNSSTSAPMYPASYNNVISVAATDINDKLATFTNYGSTIDVSAPGVNIVSTIATTNSSYLSYDGTSMASPLVAGLCGLMLSNNPLMIPDSVEACLKRTCVNINAQNPGFIGQMGAGRVDAQAALVCTQKSPTANFDAYYKRVCSNKSITFVSTSSGVSTLTYNWSFSGGTPASSTLANPSVSYAANGTYSVSLTVTNAFGNSSITKTNFIQVGPPTAVLSGDLPKLASATGYLRIDFVGNPPYSVTLSDGTTNTTQNGITSNPYFFPVTPSKDTSVYSIVSFADTFCAGTGSGSATVMKYKNNNSSFGGCLKIKNYVIISEGMSGFTSTLQANGGFGFGVDNIGDRDADGIEDVAIGAYNHSNGGTIYSARLNANGTVKNLNEISATVYPSFGANLGGSWFGSTTCNIGDLNGDGVTDLVSSGHANAGKLIVMMMNANNTMQSYVVLANGLNGIPAGTISAPQEFGSQVSNIGDWDGDGIKDLLVGSYAKTGTFAGQGSFYLVLLNSNGTCKSISNIGGNPIITGLYPGGYYLGNGCLIGDIDGDGIKELAIGVRMAGTSAQGGVMIVSVNSSGVVTQVKTLTHSSPGLNGIFAPGDQFGNRIKNYGDIDGNGVNDILVASRGVSDGGTGRGGFALVLLNSDGTCKKAYRISQTFPGLTATLNNNGLFGFDVAVLSDMDANGYKEILVGQTFSTVTGINKGAAWVIFLEDSCLNPVTITCAKSTKTIATHCANDTSFLNINKIGIKNIRWTKDAYLSNDTIKNPFTFTPVSKIYFASYVDSNGCSFVDTFSITVKQKGILNTMPDTLICIGDSARLRAGGPGVSFVWTPSTGLSSSTISNPWAKPIVNTTYYLRFIDTAGCVQRDTILVATKTCCSVRAKFVISDSVICGNNIIAINNQTTYTGVLTSNWTFGSSASISGFIGNSPPSINYNSGGIKKIKLVASNGICTDSVEKQIVVTYVKPNAGRDTAVCNASPLLLNLGSTFNPDWTYSWAPTAGLSDSKASAPIATVNSSISYIVQAVDKFSGCVGFDTVLVRIDTLTSINYIKPDSVCLNTNYQVAVTTALVDSVRWLQPIGNTNSLNLTAKSDTMIKVIVYRGLCSLRDSFIVKIGSGTVLKILGDTTFCAGSKTVLSVVTPFNVLWSSGSTAKSIDVTTAGKIKCTLTSGCPGSDSVNVTMIMSPPFNISGTTNYCEGGSVVLTANGRDSARWVSPTANNRILNSTAVNSSWMKTISFYNKCTYNDSVYVQVDKKPNLKITGDTVFCEGSTATLTATSGSGIEWNDMTTNNVKMVSDSGWYRARTTNTNTCPNVFDSIYVRKTPLPYLFIDSVQYAEAGQLIQLKVNSNATKYSWTPPTYLSCADCFNPKLVATNSIKYFITASIGNCETKKWVEVIVNKECEVVIPNAFSPNWDNVNDYFRVISKCEPEIFELQVYNRWGERVFYSNNINEKWDGSYYGSVLPVGTYIYFVKGVFLNKPTFERMGNITLLK